MNLAMRPPVLSTLSVQEAFMVYMMVALRDRPGAVESVGLLSALVVRRRRALSARETPGQRLSALQRWAVLAGVILCEVFALPKAVNFLLIFNDWLGLQPEVYA